MAPMQMNPTSPPIFQNAGYPFEDRLGDADVILRSTKSNVDFYVLKTFLSYASPFFKQMFTLPQDGVNQDMKDGLPIIPVEEDEETVNLLLIRCYPRFLAQPDKNPDLGSLILVLEASRKYQMEDVEKYIRAEVVAERFMTSQPMRVYAIAIRHGLVREATLAARETLRLPLLGREYIDELEDITAGALYRLQSFHMLCSDAAVHVATHLEWLTSDKFTWFECAECSRFSVNTSITPVTIAGHRRKRVLSKWWADYMTQATAALGTKPSGATVIHVELMDDALRKANQCSSCRGRVFEEMREFSGAFATEVDRATSDVSIPIISIDPGEDDKFNQIGRAGGQSMMHHDMVYFGVGRKFTLEKL
jgi:BTB/POZ domain